MSLFEKNAVCQDKQFLYSQAEPVAVYCEEWIVECETSTLLRIAYSPVILSVHHAGFESGMRSLNPAVEE